MKQLISAVLLYLKTWITIPARLILSEKTFNRYYRDQHLYYKNPLFNHQKYKYRDCGCGSGLKVKWCCGKGKWISYNQYEQFKIGLRAWEDKK